MWRECEECGEGVECTTSPIDSSWSDSQSKRINEGLGSIYIKLSLNGKLKTQEIGSDQAQQHSIKQIFNEVFVQYEWIWSTMEQQRDLRNEMKEISRSELQNQE